MFFTREEWSCLFSLAFESSGKLAQNCIELIEEFCFREVEKEFNLVNIFKLDLLVGGFESYLGNIGRYDDSLRMGNIMLELFLRDKRMNALSNNLYNNIWNFQQMKGDLRSDIDIKESLEKCIILSDLVHKNNWTKFYTQKLHDWEMVN